MSGDHAHAPGVLTEIDHVGIAVRDLDAAVEWYERMFGATVAHRERVESDGVEEVMLRVAESYIQLLTPTRDDSTVAKYLANRGEGIHHVGMAIGNGQFVQAPHTGDVVKISSLSDPYYAAQFAGGRRYA